MSALADTAAVNRFSGRVLADMSDGVMVIDRSGHILAFNPAAERILGMSASEVLGKPFGAAFFLLEDNDEFNQAVLDAVRDGAVGRQQQLRFTRGDGQAVALSLTSTYLQGEGDAKSQPSGVILVFSDVTELQSLQAAQAEQARRLQEQHGQLQQAFREVESNQQRAESALRRVRLLQRAGGVAALVCALAVSGFLWWQYRADASAVTAVEGGGGEAPAAGAPMATVREAPLSVTVDLPGRLAPLRQVPVTSPFQGRLLKQFVDWGQLVRRGDALFEFDTAELRLKQREVATAALKAQEQVTQIERWDQGAEATRARRAVARARLALDAQTKVVRETERLHTQGIVPLNELESARQYQVSLEMDFQSARDEAVAALARGSPEALRLARMDLENQRGKLGDIERELQAARVLAPVEGIVMRPPPPSGGRTARALAVGETYGPGEALLSLGDVSGLQVNSRVDEVEVTRLRAGQKVRVTGDAFPGLVLDGVLKGVAPQVEDGGEGRSQPFFAVQAVVESLTPEQRQRAWAGMSANLRIQVLEEPRALLLPPAAVHDEGGVRWVWRVPPAGGQPSRVTVTTGHVGVDAVQITGGLRAGDQVLLGAAGP